MVSIMEKEMHIQEHNPILSGREHSLVAQVLEWPQQVWAQFLNQSGFLSDLEQVT